MQVDGTRKSSNSGLTNLPQTATLTLKIVLIHGLLIAVVALPGFAVEADAQIELLPFWEQGDKFDYQIIKTRQKFENGHLKFDATTRTDLSLEVVNSADEGYQLSWTMGETRYDDPAHAQNPLVRQMSGLTKDFSFLLNVDEVGNIQGVANWQQLQSKFSEALKLITAELRRGGVPETQIDQIRQNVQGMFATKERIELFALEEPQIFLLPLGISYSFADPIEYEDRVPNPFGGEPFPTVGTFSLRQYEDETMIAQVLWEQTFDSKAATRILEEIIQGMAAESGKPVEQFESLKTFSIEDRAEFSVDASTGWVIKMEYVRTVKSGTGSQEDTLVITRHELGDSPKNP